MTLTRSVFLLLAYTLPTSLWANTIYFPQVVFGGGYSTTFVILNTGAAPVLSSVNFYDQSGSSRVALRRAINVAPGGSTRFTLPNTGPLTVLWGELAAGSGAVEGTATYDLRTDNSALITTATVSAMEASNAFRVPVDITSDAATGIAIAHVRDAGGVNVNLRLLREDGSQMAAATDARVAPLGSRRQIADLVTSMFPQLAGTAFKGTLIVEAGGKQCH
ncbi:MAG: hypothetical protein HY646_02970 [Acidobacteria bacterium]|nr:hypothetical protein [Acidobacteriota bacterium]